MIGILFSTIEEAQPFLSRYGGGRFGDLREGEIVHDDHVMISASGIGKIKATLHTERMLRRFEIRHAILVGTCTALSDDIDIGTLVGVTAVLEGDRIDLSKPSYPQMPLDVPFATPTQGTLVTQDHLPRKEEERGYWQRIADISDSTGYAVAYVAAQHGTPCYITRVVTSRAGVDNDSFQDDLQAAHQTISGFLVDHVGKEAEAPPFSE